MHMWFEVGVIMNRFKNAKKNNIKLEECSFNKHGFVKCKEANKKVYVSVKEIEYKFDYETNKIYEISSDNIKFAICVNEGKQYLFINQDFIPTADSTSPYRTFYDGLMKEPFKFCYPFDEQVIIKVTKRTKLKFSIVIA